jgi:predicted nucleic acid-binding protein
VLAWLDGDETALVVGRLRAAPALDDVTPDRVLAAAHTRADHPIAFADCIAVATAAVRDATLWTGDPDLIERDLGCRVSDLRAGAGGSDPAP